MLITNRNQFDQMLASVRSSEAISFDCEATGLYLRHGDHVVGIALYTEVDGNTWYLPLRHGYSDTIKKPNRATALYFQHLQAEAVAQNMPFEWVQELIEVWLMPKLHIAHNAQFDLTALDLMGFPTPPNVADTMVMLSVVNTDWRGDPKEGIIPKFKMPDTGLEESGSRELKWQARLWGLDKATQGIDGLTAAYNDLQERVNALAGKRKARICAEAKAPVKFLWALRPDAMSQYAEDDTRLTYLLYHKIMRWADKWNDHDVLKILNDVNRSVWFMNKHGLRIDVEAAKSIVSETEAAVAPMLAEIERLSGGIITKINSAPQIKKYLKAVGVSVAKTDKEALTEIDLPVIKLILKARPLMKRVTTYVGKWCDNHVNGLIHPTVNFGAASTIRATSADDKAGNFQNIPRDDASIDINPKDYILPPDGMLFCEIDYSGMELVLAAYFAEVLWGLDPNYTLTRIMEGENPDAHTRTMEMAGLVDIILKGKTAKEWLDENGYKNYGDPDKYFKAKIARMRAKTGGFAVLYGGGVSGVSRGVKCSPEEAEAIITGFHKAYPAMAKALDKCAKDAMTPKPLPNGKGAGFYITYPMKGMQLHRKYGYYPTQYPEEYKSKRNRSPRSDMSRSVLNTKIQGTGALAMAKSIARIEREITYLTKNANGCYNQGRGIVPQITVHDSLLFALYPEQLALVAEVVRIMTDFDMRPRLSVEVSLGRVGEAWSKLGKVKDLNKWIEENGYA